MNYNFEIPKDKKVIIIEGIAGSGKTTLLNYIKEKFPKKKIYVFSENEMLFSWKHINLPNISEIRLKFFDNLLNYIETSIKKDDELIFVLERFHITLKYFGELKKNQIEDYNSILVKLKKMSPYLIFLMLDENKIKERSIHKERGIQWEDYIKLKMKKRNFKNFSDMYIDEQKKIKKIIEEQSIPYSIINN